MLRGDHSILLLHRRKHTGVYVMHHYSHTDACTSSRWCYSGDQQYVFCCRSQKLPSLHMIYIHVFIHNILLYVHSNGGGHKPHGDWQGNVTFCHWSPRTAQGLYETYEHKLRCMLLASWRPEKNVQFYCWSPRPHWCLCDSSKHKY